MDTDIHGSSHEVGTCPRCGDKWDMRGKSSFVGHFPALSRRDNKTYICSSCGNVEVFEDSGFTKWKEDQPIYWEMPTECGMCGKKLGKDAVQIGYRSVWAHRKCVDNFNRRNDVEMA